MSEASMSSWAIPLHRLKSVENRAPVARRLGMHGDDFGELLDHRAQGLIPFDFAYDEDGTTIATVDDVICLCWTVTHAADADEGTAIVLRANHIPFIRWWRGSTVYGPGMEAYTGLADGLLVRCDDDLQPVIGIAVRRGCYVFDASEIAAANDYLAARYWVLHTLTGGTHG